MARGLFIEPFYGGSHKAFLDGLIRESSHEIVPITLGDTEWRKRMRRGAIELAPIALETPGQVDFIIASDMLDLGLFLGLTRKRFGSTPVLLYFHENQLTYPRIKGTKLNSWFGAVNYSSALVADVVAFNSEYHRQSFLGALRELTGIPNNWLEPTTIDGIAARSTVLPVGLDLDWIDHGVGPRPEGPPIVLWNHRWEFDKSPEMFVRVLRQLAAEGVDFRIAVAGEPGPNPHPALVGMREEFGERMHHHGYAESRGDYARLLHEASIVVSTSRHEFFGISTIEAMYARCAPVLPWDLNYPALIPDDLKGRFLYKSEAECVDLLRGLLTSGASAVEREALRSSAERYSWRRVRQEWVAAIDGLIEEG